MNREKSLASHTDTFVLNDKEAIKIKYYNTLTLPIHLLLLIRSVLRASKFSVLDLIEIEISWIYYTAPFGFGLFQQFLGISFQLFKLLSLAKNPWQGSSARNAHMVHIVHLIQTKMV